MTAHEETTWQRLQALSPGLPGAKFTFVERLAQENGWTLARTRRVLEEYRRFLFLAVNAGHPVAPPDPVDQAWHLHLIYTDSYWNDLCKGILGRPFHHGPTKGGQAEGAKFRDWYARTLASYEKYFGPPPIDIWPPVDERFANARYRRVNIERHWVIRKPRWLGRLPRLAAMLGAGGGLVMAAFLAGCAIEEQNTWNVFNWTGPAFLEFFGIFAVADFALAVWLRWWLQRTPPLPESAPLSDPYQIALLSGGMVLATNIALINLISREEVEVETGRNPTVRLLKAPAADTHYFERAVAEVIARHQNLSMKTLRTEMAAAASPMTDELSAQGLILSHDQRRLARWLPFALASLVPVVAIIKIIVGLSRDKPVEFLVAGLVICGILTLKFADRVWRSHRGTQALKLLRNSHAHLLQMHQADLNIATLPLATAIFGMSVLQSSPFEHLRERLQPPGDFSSGCSTGCGGGGSGCGGGGGGGCGGCGGGSH